MKMPLFIRYPSAVVAGAALGELFSLPVGVALDVVFGAYATGGRWPLTVPNVILVCIKGVLSGYIAGWIAKGRGKLLGALTVFVIPVIFLAVSIAMNRDLTAFFDSHYDTRPALWSWIALLPAIFGGHLGVKHGSKRAVLLGNRVRIGGNVWLLFRHYSLTRLHYSCGLPHFRIFCSDHHLYDAASCRAILVHFILARHRRICELVYDLLLSPSRPVRL